MNEIQLGTGIFLGIIAGIFLGSFALPMKKIKIWQWEHTWLVFTVWATIIFPIIYTLYTVKNLSVLLQQMPGGVVVTVLLFGAGWGIANVGYGIGLKKVGLALGTAIVLGLNNAIGAILPIILYNPDTLQTLHGKLIVLGVIIMLIGIVVCALAGNEKNRMIGQSDKQHNKSHYTNGLLVCIVAGIMGAMFNFALISGKPLADLAIKHGTDPLFSSNITWVIALSGGGIVTFIYCILLYFKNKNFNFLFNSGTGINWLFTFVMGILWFGGVVIYGISVTKLGVLGASIGWPIIQSVAVGSGNALGIITGEWTGSGKKAMNFLYLGMGFLFLGIVIVSLSLNFK